jgi:membrane-associated protease RseP (regulator of RpoE activity)
MAARWGALIWVIALFSPVGHEFVIWLGMREETNRQPIYAKPPAGVMILDVMPGTAAAKSNLQSRDIIIGINGEQLYNFHNLQELLNYGRGFARLEIIRNGRTLYTSFRYKSGEDTGIIPVPEENAAKYLVVNLDGIFTIARKFWRSLINRIR